MRRHFGFRLQEDLHTPLEARTILLILIMALLSNSAVNFRSGDIRQDCFGQQPRARDGDAQNGRDGRHEQR